MKKQQQPRHHPYKHQPQTQQGLGNQLPPSTQQLQQHLSAQQQQQLFAMMQAAATNSQYPGAGGQMPFYFPFDPNQIQAAAAVTGMPMQPMMFPMSGQMQAAPQFFPQAQSLPQHQHNNTQSQYSSSSHENRRSGGSGARRDRDTKSTREDRPEREVQSRTLFVRNINYDTPESELRELFGRHGDLKTVFSLLEKRGLVFITFFDLRASESARMELNGFDVRGRKIDVHYSVPKDEDMNSRTCDGEKNQGTILLTLKDGKQALDNTALQEYFSQFGDVKVVRNYKEHPNQRFIEYWDSRHCQAAVQAAHGASFNGGHLDLRFAWDTPHKFRSGGTSSQEPPTQQRQGRRDGGRDASGPDRRRRRDHDNDRDRDDRGSRASDVQSIGSQPWLNQQPSQSSLNHQAQQAQQMLASLTQTMGGQIPQMPMGYSVSATGQQQGMIPQLTPQLPAPQTNTPSQSQPSVPMAGPEALAQMNQLLQLLQQNSGAVGAVNNSSNTVGISPNSNLAHPKDPRQKSSSPSVIPIGDDKSDEDRQSLASSLLKSPPQDS